MISFTQHNGIYITNLVCYNYCEAAGMVILSPKTNEQGVAK